MEVWESFYITSTSRTGPISVPHRDDLRRGWAALYQIQVRNRAVMATTDSVLKRLVGEQLSAVTFVMDYLHLDFDGQNINLYVWPTIEIEGEARGGPQERQGLGRWLCCLHWSHGDRCRGVPDRWSRGPLRPGRYSGATERG